MSVTAALNVARYGPGLWDHCKPDRFTWNDGNEPSCTIIAHETAVSMRIKPSYVCESNGSNENSSG